MERVDCVVVGAGVVGLACARRLAMAGLEVIVLERADAIGTETSARNSEVIHAGIYYAAGSLKARFCIEGKQFLYRYCAEHGVAHVGCGKLIVATDEAQLAQLQTIRSNAAAIGMPDLEPWTAAQAQALEPALRCTGALWSPTTGVIDSHGLMLAYLADAERHGAMIAFESPLLRAEVRSRGHRPGGGRHGAVAAAGPPCRQQRGPACARPGPALRRPWRRGPADGLLLQGQLLRSGRALAVLAADLSGARAGRPRRACHDRPCRALPLRTRHGMGRRRSSYPVDPARADSFYAAVRTYWPDLPDGALLPDYAGVRPKLGPAGSPAQDFVISGPEQHGVAGLVELFGIESPGLTASWPIACEVGRRLGLPLPDAAMDESGRDREPELVRMLEQQSDAEQNEVGDDNQPRQHGRDPEGSVDSCEHASNCPRSA